MSKKITSEQLLAEIERVARTGPDAEGMTAVELAAASGHDVRWVRAWLRQIQAAGRLIVAWRTVPRIDGRTHQVPVYRISK